MDEFKVNKINKGKLIKWDKNKGFGFIHLNNQKNGMFIHISALKKMSRPPIVGDIILYEIHTDNKGEKRAVNAKIEGVLSRAEKVRKNVRKNLSAKTPPKSSLYEKLIFVGFIIVGVGAYIHFSKQDGSPKIYNKTPNRTPVVSSTPVVRESLFSCNGKVHCSEMSSCAEARYYQNNCPGTKMDGDGDGIPCERQC
jgi:cold shock CspA family protein